MDLRYEKVSSVLVIAQQMRSKISIKGGKLIKLLRPTDLNTIALHVATLLPAISLRCEYCGGRSYASDCKYN